MLTRFLGVLLLSVAGAVSGSDVYRSVDENGNVTYASQPVQDAVETTPVRIESGPSVRQLREANEQSTELLSTVRHIEDRRARQKAMREQAIEAAEQDLALARSKLAEAKVPRDGDWQSLPSGGRQLRQTYFERVLAAEAEVRAAEQRLADTGVRVD